MSKMLLDTLILMVTYRCNLSCSYCPVIKSNRSMPFDLARKALNIFVSRNRYLKKIRFFGGEPLIRFGVVKQIVNACRNRGNNRISFDLTTNGTLLTGKILKFFADNPKIELILSLDGDSKTQALNKVPYNPQIAPYYLLLEKLPLLLKLPLVTVNMVAAPNQVSGFFNNFNHILSLGFRRFNFLPAYYVPWKKAELKVLRSEFNKIAKLIAGNKDIYVKNLSFCSETALFNNAVVVDCNGDIFPNNIVLSRDFFGLRNRMKLGNVKDFRIDDLRKGKSLSSLMGDEAYKRIIDTVEAPDEILTNFVERLKHEKS